MPEQQNIEWKESWNDKYLSTVSAFANTQGGTLVIGKNDDGVIVGVQNAKKLLEDIPSKISNKLGIHCEVILEEENSLEYIQIIVPIFSSAIAYDGRYYTRSGSTTRLLTGGALSDFLLKKSNIDWDEVIVEGATIEDIDPQAIETFKKNAVESGRLPFIDSANIREVLENLNLIGENGGIKRAGVLLFAKQPHKFIHSAYIKIGRFGQSHSELLSQEVVEENAFEIADKVIKILDEKYIIRNISYDGLRRIETPEYPFKAVREALFNAITHREYEITPIFLKLHDDRMSVLNQGELTEKLKVEDLKKHHLSYPRNKLVASVFYKAGFIETWGRGTITILEECKRHGLPEPKLEVYGGAFSITLFKEIYNEEYLSKLDINDRQKEAIKYIKENESITNSIYRDLFEIAKRTASRDIEELLDLKMIQKIGSGPSTKYIISVEGYDTRG